MRLTAALGGNRLLVASVVALLCVTVATTFHPRPADAATGDVIAGYKDRFSLVTGANQQVEVGRLNLPAGRYTVFAKLFLQVPLPSGDKRTVRCNLQAGADFDRTVADHDGNLAFTPVSLNVVHHFTTSGPAVLTCGHDFTAGSTTLGFIKITAISTGSLVNNPMP